MKPFEYVAARTIDEAVEALASSKGPAKPLAGGTDLVVQLNEGRITLLRQEWHAPERVPFGAEELVPLRAGESIPWKLA